MNQRKGMLYAGLVAGLFATLAATPVLADEAMVERLERLERIVESRALRDMGQRIDTLQREVQELRGTVEEQDNMIARQGERIRDLYGDLDQRLLDLERQGRPQGRSTNPLVDVDGSGEREDYREAFELLRELRYEEAVAAFRGFLDKHPDGRYANTARYWLAEGEYAQRHFDRAIEAYEDMLEQHPDSPRAAEAYLKIGYSHQELGALDEARRVVEELISAYPDSTEASQGERMLRAIRQEQRDAEDGNGEDE